MIEQTRKQYAAAWKAWKKANRIRRALADLTGNRNGPGKAWADECRVILARAERAHRRALSSRDELHRSILRAFRIGPPPPRVDGRGGAQALLEAWRRRHPQIAAFWRDLPVYGSRDQVRQQILSGSSISRPPEGEQDPPAI